MQKDWFSEWFNTPYYHILYKDRNDEEAEDFINVLVHFLNPDSNATFLDLACGKGRHAVFLNSLGYQVDGCDLAEESIKVAKTKEKENLHFFVQDMRSPTPNQYDYILNLFTSIGYFEDFQDNEKTFGAIASNLNSGGVFVLDFLNASKVESDLIPFEEKEIEDIIFHISKKIENKQIIKTIEFSADDQEYKFREEVSLLKKEDFISFAKTHELELLNEFGNYQLDPFHDQSERLILIFKKK